MAEFVKVGELESVAPGSCIAVEANGRQIALFNVDGSLYALDNTCLHRGGPLGEGDLDGSVVTCPWHGWQYDVHTGQKCGDPSIGVARYDVKVEGGAIFVAI